MKRHILFISSLAIASVAQAQPDYFCTIERVYAAGDESSEYFTAKRKRYTGEKFMVDRETGVMVGALKNQLATRPVVIDHGTAGNGFKVVTTMRLDQGYGAGTEINALVVEEFRDSQRKPFSYMNSDTVYFGHCEHATAR